MIDYSKVYAVLICLNPKAYRIIAGPENIEILMNMSQTELLFSRPLSTRQDLMGVCKAINESRLPEFDRQNCINLVLEKYPIESLIYVENKKEVKNENIDNNN